MDHLEVILTRPDGLVYALLIDIRGKITLVTPDIIPTRRSVFRDLGKARLALIRLAGKDTSLRGQQLPPPATWTRYPDHLPQERPLLVIQAGVISPAHAISTGSSRAVVIGSTPVSIKDGAWWSYAP